MRHAVLGIKGATEPGDSFLVNTEEMNSLLAGAGLAAEVFEDVSDALFSTNVVNSTPAPPGQLGLAVYEKRITASGRFLTIAEAQRPAVLSHDRTVMPLPSSDGLIRN